MDPPIPYQKIALFQNKAIEWLYVNRKEIELLFYKSNLYHKDYLYSLKLIGELLLLCSIYKRANVPLKDELITKIVLFAKDLIESSDYVDRITRLPTTTIAYASIYAFLFECGFELSNLKRTLETVINNNYSFEKESPPYILMECRHILEKARLRHNLPSLSQLYKLTLLSKKPSILHLNLHDIYAITHIIFYLGDFGFKNSIELPCSEIKKLRWIVFNLIGLYLKEYNWDILAELLICTHCLDYCPSPLYEITWNNIINHQHRDGSIEVHPSNYKYDNRLKQHNFKQKYHPTLITAMASILYFQLPEISTYNIRYTLINDTHRTQAQLSCERSYKWLKKISDHSNNNETFLLNILLGEWIYHNMIYHKLKDLSHSYNNIKTINENLDIVYRSKPKSISSNITISLLSTCILRKLNLQNDVLESFAKDVCNNFLKCHFNTEIGKVKVFPIYFLLQELFNIHIPTFDSITLSNLEQMIEETYTKKYLILDISSYVSAATRFGKKKLCISDPKLLNQLITAISISTTHSLYVYNLDWSLRLLRTMNYLKMYKDKSFIESINFLNWQQNYDGKIGFFTPEIIKLKQDHQNMNYIDTIYLPLTISFMWTITSMNNPSLDIFNSIIFEKANTSRLKAP